MPFHELCGLWTARSWPALVACLGAQGSGFGFRSVQICFATCDQIFDKWDANKGGSMTTGPLHWGVAATETSINGLYYKHLPAASLVCGPKLETASWAMRHMTQASTFIPPGLSPSLTFHDLP